MDPTDRNEDCETEQCEERGDAIMRLCVWLLFGWLVTPALTALVYLAVTWLLNN